MSVTPPTSAVTGESCAKKREEFLLEVYRQTSGHLGRHISGVWQCVGVVGAALIVFAKSNDMPLNDYACTLVVILCGWLAATTLDASNWFNRNLAIITNIERLFLTSGDLKLVHYFFGTHRAAGKRATHFQIQLCLSAAVCLLILIHHFAVRVFPGFSSPWTNFELSRAMPYIFTAVVLCLLLWLANHYKESDRKFKVESPGISL